MLPADHTNSDLPFKIIRTDYAGPFLCKAKGKMERKVYLLLFTCSLSRAIHLDVLPYRTTQEFIHALKRLMLEEGDQKKSTQITPKLQNFRRSIKMDREDQQR